MKNQDCTATSRRQRLSVGLLAAGLFATLMLIDAGLAVAQEEEKEDPAKISMGRNVFRSWCRTCHGETAKGDGPMAENLRVPPSDLTLLRQNNGGYFYFERIAEKIDGRAKVRGHGSKDMPVWGDAFEVLDEEGGAQAVREKINSIVHYLRSIQASTDESTP